MRYMQLGQQSVIGDGRISATGSSSYSLDNRRCSLVDLTVSRHARRETVLHQKQENLLESSNCSAGSSAAPRRQTTKLLGEYLEKWSVLPRVSPPRPLDKFIRRLAGSLMSPVLFFAPSCLVAGQCHNRCRVAFKLRISSSEILYFVDRESRYEFLLITNLTHFFAYLFISSLYLFRASQCPSSGDRIVLIHHLV